MKEAKGLRSTRASDGLTRKIVEATDEQADAISRGLRMGLHSPQQSLRARVAQLMASGVDPSVKVEF